MEVFNFDIEKDVKINRYRLEEELSKQAVLFLHYSEAVAEAKAERDEAKSKLENAKANIELLIRKNPEKYLDGLKVTESVISSAVTAHTQIVKLNEEYSEKLKAVNDAESAVRALEHKKSALEDLRYLLIAGFYSYPSGDAVSDDLSDKARRALNNRKNKKEAE